MWSFYLLVYHCPICCAFLTFACLTYAGEDIVFTATDIKLPGNVEWVMLQSCFDAHFLLVLEKHGLSRDGVEMFYIVVQLIGTDQQADNFSCRYLMQLRYFVVQFSHPVIPKLGLCADIMKIVHMAFALVMRAVLC